VTARGVLLGLVALGALAGCGPASLDVRYPEAGANRALLGTVASRRVEIKPVIDARADTTRLGVRPEKGKDFVPSRPVTDIVREALAVEVARNGHTLAGAPSDIALTADVEEFWLDVVRGYTTTQYVGKVAFTLTALDGHTGDRLAARRYLGITRRQVEEPSDAAARDVLTVALARAVRDLATDPTLASAFGRAGGVTPPTR
jgi:hypothetical protein